MRRRPRALPVPAPLTLLAPGPEPFPVPISPPPNRRVEHDGDRVSGPMTPLNNPTETRHLWTSGSPEPPGTRTMCAALDGHEGDNEVTTMYACCVWFNEALGFPPPIL
jgi:hypothetical protein